jgi:fused signal recognition particle receptor
MSSTVIIILAVIAVVVVVVLVVRGKKPVLPSEVSEPKPTPAKLPAKAEPGAAKAKEAAAAVTAEAEAEGVDVVIEPVTADEEKAPPPVPGKRARPNKEDVATLQKGLAGTRNGFISRLAGLFSGKKEIDPGLLDEIEEVLITADVGVKTSQRILERLRDRMSKRELTDPDRVWAAIREEAEAILTQVDRPVRTGEAPHVIAVIGVNGVGKTTTIGKLASRYAADGKKVVLAAGDTFRAAAVLQLEVWGRRVSCPVVKGKENADPGSVVFDAIKRAQADGADVLIIDTAGRLHTKAPLMDELKKVGRTIEKALSRPADEILLVLDATNGQNALQQAQLFREAMDVNGIVLTKLDGTAKGGVVLGIVDEQKLPIRFIGIGERVEDLRSFDVASFVEALFEKPENESSAA